MNISKMPQRAWREVDLAALRHNFFLLRARAPHARICPVLKANAYGHGAARLAPLCEGWGAAALAVATVGEALALRAGGARAPIYLLGAAPPAAAPALVKAGITPTVHSPESARALSAAVRAAREGAPARGEAPNPAAAPLPVQIKIDTGMGRLGFVAREGREEGTARAVLAAAHLPNLRAVGIFTHFPRADESGVGLERTKAALSRFLVVRRHLARVGLPLPAHAANSAATLALPASHLDMIRPGIALYGIDPREVAPAEVGAIHESPAPVPSPVGEGGRERAVTDEASPPAGASSVGEGLAPPTRSRALLSPALTVKAIVTQVKWLKKGDTVGYGGNFAAPRRMRVATLAIGYGDGLCRRHAETGGGVEATPPAPNKKGVPHAQNPAFTTHAPGHYPSFVGEESPLPHPARRRSAPRQNEDFTTHAPRQTEREAVFLPFVGRISMDQCTVDATAAPFLCVGDSVTVLGGRGRVSFASAAARVGSIPYELLVTLSPRLPILYINGD